MNLNKLLQSFEEQAEELRTFEEENAQIFEEYARLKEELAVREGKVKDTARILKEKEVVGEHFVVIAQRRFSKWYDSSVVLKEYPQARNFKGLIVESVDDKILKKLIEAEQIPTEVAKKAYREEEQTTAITIKRRDESKE